MRYLSGILIGAVAGKLAARLYTLWADGWLIQEKTWGIVLQRLTDRAWPCIVTGAIIGACWAKPRQPPSQTGGDRR